MLHGSPSKAVSEQFMIRSLCLTWFDELHVSIPCLDLVVQAEQVVEIPWLTRNQNLVNQGNRVMYSKLVDT